MTENLKLDVDRLLKDEIIFEIRCRGASVDESLNLKDLNKILRELLSLEQGGKSFRGDLSFIVFQDEPPIISKKLDDIDIMLQGEITKTSIRKIGAKLCHILNRVECLTSNVKEELEEKSKLLTRTLSYITKFNEKCNKAKKDPATMSMEVEFERLKSQDNATSTPKGKITSPVSEAIDSDTARHSDAIDVQKLLEKVTLRETVDLSKWNLRFSGGSDILGLSAFLERVNELCESRNISKEQLFKSCTELFEGEALVWLRSVRDNITDWDSLCSALRREFLPHDYVDQLWDQIKKRTQGDTEPISIYIAYMTNLFKRLTIPISEEIKLKIIMKNILPFYTTQLTLVTIDSVEQLIDYCKKLEIARYKAAKFKPPVLDKHQVEVDLNYTKVPKGKISNIEVTKSHVTFAGRTQEIPKQETMSMRLGDELDRSPERFVDRNIRSNVREARDFGDRNGDNHRSRDRYRNNSVDRYRSRYENSRDTSREKYRGDSRESHRYRNSSCGSRESSGSRYRHDSRDRYRNGGRDDFKDGSRNNFRSHSKGKFRDATGDRFEESSGNRNRLGSHGRRRYLNRHNYGSNGNSDNSSNTCFKCRGANHIARNCTAKTCFGCGRVGFVKANCPSCTGNLRRN